MGYNICIYEQSEKKCIACTLPSNYIITIGHTKEIKLHLCNQCMQDLSNDIAFVLNKDGD